MSGQLRLEAQGSPRGIKRLGFRLPIYLYKAHLGFLMGHRFLMLQHTGRSSGEKRFVVLEVVVEEADAVYVAAGWGSEAQWLQNVRANPTVRVQLGRTSFTTRAEPIDPTEAGRVLAEYGEAHPSTLAKLAKFMLVDPGETAEEHVANVSANVPMVRLPIPA